MSETIFTPFFLPVIAFVSYRDQTKRARKKKSEKTQEVGKDNENLDITSEDARRTKNNSVVTTKEKDQTSEKSKMKADGKNKSKDIWGMIKGILLRNRPILRQKSFPFFAKLKQLSETTKCYKWQYLECPLFKSQSQFFM